jgi:hypothetical protein
MSNRQLEMIRWASGGASLAIALVLMLNPALRQGGFGVLLFFGFVVLGFPAAMITMHLHPPKWLIRHKGD